MAVPAADTLVLLVDRTTLVTIDTSRYDCQRPGQPSVYQDQVYVPCDNGNVMAYDRAGRHVRTIPTDTDRRPFLVLDEGLLFISTPGGPTTGAFIDEQGVLHPLGPLTDDLPLHNPADPPPPVGPGVVGPGVVGPGPIGRGPIGPDAPTAPTNVTATVTNGQVTIRWQHSGDVDGFTVLRTSPDTDLSGLLPAAQRTFIITDLGSCNQVSFVVVNAIRDNQAAPSTPNQITLPPDPPSTLAIGAVADNATSLTLPVTVGPARPRCAPVTGYTITATDAPPANLTIPGTLNITIACGGPCWDKTVAVTAVARSTAGDSTPATSSYTHPPAPPPFPNGPFEQDDVIVDITSSSALGPCVPVTPEPCFVPYTFYTAQFDPPPSWRTFGGTCTPIVNGNPETPFDCATADSFPAGMTIGGGISPLRSVAVQACLANVCVTSAPHWW